MVSPYGIAECNGNAVLFRILRCGKDDRVLAAAFVQAIYYCVKASHALYIFGVCIEEI